MTINQSIISTTHQSPTTIRFGRWSVPPSHSTDSNLSYPRSRGQGSQRCLLITSKMRNASTLLELTENLMRLRNFQRGPTELEQLAACGGAAHTHTRAAALACNRRCRVRHERDSVLVQQAPRWQVPVAVYWIATFVRVVLDLCGARIRYFEYGRGATGSWWPTRRGSFASAS
jgi:hypothetical protein